MTKAGKIRELYRLGYSDNEIAREVGCGTAYVRTCARQRVDGGRSVGDRRYLAANHEKIVKRAAAYKRRRRAEDPAYRIAENVRRAERSRKRYWSDPKYRARMQEKVRLRLEKLRKAAKASQEAYS